MKYAIVLSRISVPLLCCAALVGAHAGGQCKDFKPSNNALQGGTKAGQYDFGTFSDHSPLPAGLVRFTNLLRNDSAAALPAQWLKAGMQHQWIAENGGRWCNFWDALNPKIAADMTALVEYGPKKPLNPAKAPIYVDAKPQPPQGQTPVLKSRVFAEINKEGKRHTVSFLFAASVSDGSFKYTFENHGSEAQLFAIPRLTAAWETFKAKSPDGMTVRKSWETGTRFKGKVLYLAPKADGAEPKWQDQEAKLARPQTFEVRADVRKFTSQTALIQFHETRDGTPLIASGRVAVYLPEKPR
jgi:hypothetical protein